MLRKLEVFTFSTFSGSSISRRFDVDVDGSFEGLEGKFLRVTDIPFDLKVFCILDVFIFSTFSGSSISCRFEVDVDGSFRGIEGKFLRVGEMFDVCFLFGSGRFFSEEFFNFDAVLCKMDGLKILAIGSSSEDSSVVSAMQLKIFF